ncbi:MULTISPECIES: DUF3105 domain-containing protein [Streptomyces]|uniref:DUF3105 domain-containing protein n=1 Tax=Streptomyces lycopersici TaxID=2974589 RepID=UPI0021D2D969|nr:DUF3105 domain-containing protein [Streptomyces sp. NEAU-383]
MGSPGAKAKREARRAKIEELRRAERARERRNRIITISASAVIVIGAAGTGWYLIDRNEQKQQARTQAASAPVKGEKSWKGLGRNHVTKPVGYKMSPPAGGDHNPTWMNCAGNVYDKEIGKTNAVHSLEHGAVWITYNDKTAERDVSTLEEKVQKTPYTLMSPYVGQSSPITLTAWGRQLEVESASDPRVQQFLTKYVQGKQTPEPGATCTGGQMA